MTITVGPVSAAPPALWADALRVSCLRRLLLDDVNHPRHAVLVGDFTETVRPEGLLSRHVDVPARGEVVEPALAF